jgi:tetratricopeptide (TPR) repeat protein
MWSLAVSLQSEAYLLGGRRDDALKLAETALDLARSHKERGYEVWTLQLLGEIQSSGESPDPRNGEPYYRQAIALATELGMRPLVAHCHLGLGKLYARTRQREQAEGRLTTATAMYREMDMRSWLEKAEAELESSPGN